MFFVKIFNVFFNQDFKSLYYNMFIIAIGIIVESVGPENYLRHSDLFYLTYLSRDVYGTKQ